MTNTETTVWILLFSRELYKYYIVPALSHQTQIYNIWVASGCGNMNQDSIESTNQSRDDTPFIFTISPRNTLSICNYQTETTMCWMSNKFEVLDNFKGFITRITLD